MRKLLKRYGRSASYLLLIDYLLIVGTFGVALRFRHYAFGMNIIDLAHGEIVPEAAFVFFYAFFGLGLFSAFNLYKRKTWISLRWHQLGIIESTVVFILIYVLFKSIFKSAIFLESRLVTFNWGVLLLLALSAHRLILFPLILRYASKAGLQRRVVVIGDGPLAKDFVRKWNAGRYSTIEVLGQLTGRGEEERALKDIPRLGDVADLRELIDLHKIEGAVIAEPGLTHQQLMDLIEECVGLFGWVDVHSAKSAVWHEKLNADLLFDIPFVRLRSIPDNPLYFGYKRMFDVVASSLGLLILSPVMIGTAIAIKVTSPGPVFYVRERVGSGGRPFKFYKFRSMAVGADKDEQRANDIARYIANGEGQQSKVVNTAYVTPVGRFIRKWAIDELPQLFNVIRGDMSLVGPRPVPPDEFNLNEEWHKRRFDIKPGCTGLWKLYASRERDTSFNQTCLYDLYYSRNMNPLMDLYIIFGTVFVILTGQADG
ncbi:exopolysaccharide biosynthesis polyprenyl glycosylphosphotransferase [Kiritimatiella glycovorans]|uniref:UDP-glucose:undecaprenyl-phosphate glucose-1-phosphate transferase n=1 Tax=Kiritimatiella glycovorans TaxID=1307763 RepID=A0A0G3EGB3_9BACT|nr:exopolysaccharide biosynthesis polyprenyl glycosylphosphotransferase [Kiritimatiella glycovorans]AKJ65506.1 UDP-glucose:undecaprenyl-phosphate glucose-1-phosphate transferase [Kiritimatiella glycovorans]